MAYTPVGWNNDQAPAINQDNLNHMDNGIVDADARSTKNEADIEILKNGEFKYVTASGNDITLESALVGDYPDIQATIEYVQEGTGDPSPTNIRPIIGKSSCVITHHLVDVTIALGRTVYSAKLDVNQRKLTLDKEVMVLDGVTNKIARSGNSYIKTIDTMKSGNAMDGVADWLKTVSTSTQTGIRFGASNKVIYIYGMTDVLGDTTTANAYLAEHPLSILYPLETEVEIDLENDLIAVLDEDDTFVSDDYLEIGYYQKNDPVQRYQGIAESGKALIVGPDGYVETGEAGVSVDETLTQPGKAADAKAVGDKLNEAETLIQEQIVEYFNEHPMVGDVTRQFLTEGDVEVGAELLDDTGWTMDGWTGSWSNGFVHTSGNTNALSRSISGLEEGSIYQLKLTTSNARIDGISDFYVSLGGSQTFETYKGGGASVSYVYGMVAGDADTLLKIEPNSSYSGIITGISLKKIITSEIDETSLYLGDDGSTCNEARFGKMATCLLAFGVNSGKKNFYGIYNTAVGYNALVENTDGFWNTAIGYNALKDNIHGSRNIAIGFIALQACTTGDRNIAIGTFALEGLTTGRGNIGIGADALQKNNGDYNIGIGVAAGGGLTNNVGVGRYAGGVGTNGKNNVSVGAYAHQQSTDTEFSVAVGYQSGQVSKGKYNTFVGGMAGKYATTGTHNIVIGYDAQLPNVTDGNTIVIGNSVRPYTVIIAGKKLLFNNDGTVTWEAL